VGAAGQAVFPLVEKGARLLTTPRIRCVADAALVDHDFVRGRAGQLLHLPLQPFKFPYGGVISSEDGFDAEARSQRGDNVVDDAFGARGQRLNHEMSSVEIGNESGNPVPFAEEETSRGPLRDLGPATREGGIDASRPERGIGDDVRERHHPERDLRTGRPERDAKDHARVVAHANEISVRGIVRRGNIIGKDPRMTARDPPVGAEPDRDFGEPPGGFHLSDDGASS